MALFIAAATLLADQKQQAGRNGDLFHSRLGVGLGTGDVGGVRMTPLNIPLEFVVIGAVIVAALGFISGQR